MTTPRLASSSVVLSLFAAIGAGACNGQVTTVLAPQPIDADGSDEPSTAQQQQTSGKVDLLLAVDNSSSMRPKQALFARAAARMIERLTHPRCVDGTGAARARSTVDERGQAVCPSGTSLEFAPVTDLHVGMISSSLGNFGNTGGSAICQDSSGRVVSDNARLVTRGLESFPREPEGFLAYGSGSQPYADSAELGNAVEALVLGAGDNGCGIEAQLESLYQFLIAPEPWGAIEQESSVGRYAGLNEEALRQRKAFLRPDSLVSVILVTDEDDASVDPLTIGGGGGFFAGNSFPGGPPRADGTTTAARGTSTCAATPTAAACTSCAFAFNSLPDEAVASDPNCSSRETAYYAADDDSLNTRFFDMKRRYGLEPRYPISRYSRGLSLPQVPSRDAEHLKSTPEQPISESYDSNAADCRNPLFAASLPDGASGELCNLPAGPRNASLVYFTVLGGAPNELLTGDALDADNRLTDGAWTALLGRDFASSDYTGVDPRMLQSIAPREGRPGVASADADANDPLNRTHRDWNTQKEDLQYACSYPLPEELVVSAAQAVDCRPGSDAPVCEPGDRQNARRQIRGRAFPTPRPFAVARALGRQATVSSLCAADVTNTEADSYGYSAAVDSLVQRMAAGLRK